MKRAMVVLGILAAAVRARAEEPPVEGSGQATIVNGDQQKAHERALDEALRHAVEAAATQRAGTITAEANQRLASVVYPHVHEYVTVYRVVEEKVVANVLRLRVSAFVDAATLAQAIATPAGPKKALPRTRVILCLMERQTAAAPFARSKTGEPRLAAFAAAHGLDPVAPMDCPLDAALLPPLMKDLGASAALVGSIEASPRPALRGAYLPVVHAAAHVNFVDGAKTGGGEPIEGAADAFADDAHAATTTALSEALADLLLRLAPVMDARFPIGTSGGVRVRLAHVERWAEVRSLQKSLAAIPGVAQVTLRRFTSDGAALLVETAAPASELAGMLNSARELGIEAKAVTEHDIDVRMLPPPVSATPAPAVPEPPPSATLPANIE